MTQLVAGGPADLQDFGTGARAPNLVARGITGRLYLSYSQLACLRACPRQFAFKYVEKAPAEFVPSGLLFGACIHSALESHFLALRDHGRAQDVPMLMAAFDDAWHDEQPAADGAISVRFNKNETAQTLRELAQRMLAAFLDSPVARPDGEIVGIEQELRVTLDPDLPDLLARIDLVTQNDSGVTITDFKTARARWTPDRALEAVDQLSLYSDALREAFADRGLPNHLQFVVLTKAKNPAIQILPVPFDSVRVETLRENVRTIWEAIQAGHFYPNPSPMHCTTCPYRGRCPVFGGA